MTITKEMVVAFIKSLERAKIVKKGSHKIEEVVTNVMECVSMSEEEFNNNWKDVQSVVFFRSEFSDWSETYKEAV